MVVIALVGESGSGKSTVAAHLEGLGATHIDADKLAHDILDQDENVKRKVREHFGESVMIENRIDRNELGLRVFSHDEALAELNAIMHPPIIAACSNKLRQLEAADVGLVVIDAALLLEVDVPFKIDFIIALICEAEERVRRLLAKGGATRREIRMRLERQARLQNSFYKADAVIDTGREKAEVLAEVENLVKGVLRGSDE